MELDFKELSNDEDMCSRLTKFAQSVDQIQEVLQFAENTELYDKLTNAEKIKFNLLMSFGLNGLFWMYLRAEGIYLFIAYFLLQTLISTNKYLIQV